MINRINLILRAKNITARQFAEEIGIQPSGMSHILGGRNNPSLDFVSKVLRRYPEIDANWLLLGKGEMYSSTSNFVASKNDAPVVDEEASQTETPTVQPEEPSLFDDPSHDWDDSSEMPQGEQIVAKEGERRYVPTYIASAPESTVREKAELVRILLIYSDNTYEELHPKG